ncbi:MAG: hypothetical protein Q8M98_11460 [Candidatus Cloacimonadaceae bacterium]|nr:hypothetical protein [Candidatus Cloacimonadaceae bacterium]MDP3115367.1 hypothetical protein [Candidatus Cloacimonadaceae bacterium]
MTKLIKIALLLWIAGAALNAELAWQAPVVIQQLDNIDFREQGVACANGNTLLLWMQVIEGESKVCLRLYDQQMQALWPQPLMFDGRSSFWNFVTETSDGAFILIGMRSNGVHAWKIGADGSHLWNPLGIQIHSNSGSNTPVFPEIAQDMSGGAYFCWWNQTYDSSRLQHVNASGVVSLPLTGMPLDSSIGNVHAKMLVLAG